MLRSAEEYIVGRRPVALDSLQIVLGASTGKSEVPITVKRTTLWSFVVRADDSGLKSTGPLYQPARFPNRWPVAGFSVSLLL